MSLGGKLIPADEARDRAAVRNAANHSDPFHLRPAARLYQQAFDAGYKNSYSRKGGTPRSNRDAGDIVAQTERDRRMLVARARTHGIDEKEIDAAYLAGQQSRAVGYAQRERAGVGYVHDRFADIAQTGAAAQRRLDEARDTPKTLATAPEPAPAAQRRLDEARDTPKTLVPAPEPAPATASRPATEEFTFDSKGVLRLGKHAGLSLDAKLPVSSMFTKDGVETQVDDKQWGMLFGDTLTGQSKNPRHVKVEKPDIIKIHDDFYQVFRYSGDTGSGKKTHRFAYAKLNPEHVTQLQDGRYVVAKSRAAQTAATAKASLS